MTFDPGTVPPAADPFAGVRGNGQAAEDWSDPASWGDPQELPAGVPPVDAFDLDLLPGKSRAWAEDVCERMQAPVDFIVVPTMVQAGAIIGRQVGIRPKRADDWLVIPNLYGSVVGRPGLLKTPCMREALGAIHTLEARARREHEREMRQYEAELKVHKIDERISEKDIEKALKDNKSAREQLIRQLVEGEAEPDKPRRKRYLTNDPTIEKLGEILRDNPIGVLLYRDELLGFLRAMERDGREQDRSFYLEAWDGCGSFTYDRIARGTIDILACVVSIVGATCPGPLQAWISARAATGQGDDGLLQRFQMAVWPDHPGDFVNVDRRPNAEAQKVHQESLLSLCEGEQVDGEEVVQFGGPDEDDDSLVTKVLRFDEDAQEQFDAWRENLERRLRVPDIVPAWESHLSKYRSLAPSIALICHLLDGRRGPVDETAWLRAEAWVEYLESHARRIYDGFLRPHSGPTHALAAKIRAGALPSPFRLREVYRPQWGGLTTRAEAELAVETLIDANWIVAEDVQGPFGRPTVQYHINPKCKGLS